MRIVPIALLLGLPWCAHAQRVIAVDLLEASDVAAMDVAAYRTPREKIVAAVADPNIGFILVALGVLGICVEFSAPGLIFPGVAGGILAALGLSSLAQLPINWAGVALLVVGVSLLIMEAKFSAHGILGIGGTVAMVLGAMLLIDGPPEMRIHLWTALSVSVPFALITVFLATLVVRARRNKAVIE